MNNNERAAILALNSCKNFLECLRIGRLPGRRNSRKAQRLIVKAHQQHRRLASLLDVA